MPWAAIIPAVAALGGAAIGAATSSGDYAQQQQAIQQEIAQYQAIGVPPAQATQIVMQKYQSAGQMTPQMQQVFNQAASQMNGVKTDPNLKTAQMGALQQLQNLGSNGGHTLTDDANLANIQNQANTANAGRIGAIQNSMQSRGLGGSGLSLAAQLQSAQDANNQQATGGLQIAANQQQNALQAIMNSGQLAGNMQGQQFNQQAQIAQAQDAINRFNTANQQQVSNTNTGIANNAQAYNLQNNQAISNKNADLTNQQNIYNAQQIQQNYQNQLSKANGMASAYGQEAQNYGQAGQRQSNLWGGIASGLGQGAAAAGAYSAMQPQAGAGGSATSSQIGSYQLPKYQSSFYNGGS